MECKPITSHFSQLYTHTNSHRGSWARGALTRGCAEAIMRNQHLSRSSKEGLAEAGAIVLCTFGSSSLLRLFVKASSKAVL